MPLKNSVQVQAEKGSIIQIEGTNKRGVPFSKFWGIRMLEKEKCQAKGA